MGWPAHVTVSHTAWEFWAAWYGYVEANSAAEPEQFTRAEFDDILRDYDPNK